MFIWRDMRLSAHCVTPPPALLPVCSSGGMELLFGNQKVVEADVPQHDGEQVRLVAAAASPP